jgi:hypothetical protein
MWSEVWNTRPYPLYAYFRFLTFAPLCTHAKLRRGNSLFQHMQIEGRVTFTGRGATKRDKNDIIWLRLHHEGHAEREVPAPGTGPT